MSILLVMGGLSVNELGEVYFISRCLDMKVSSSDPAVELHPDFHGGGL